MILVITTLDEKKNGYVARVTICPIVKGAELMPGVPDMASARVHVRTRTNQGSRIDNNTEKPYLHHQL